MLLLEVIDVSFKCLPFDGASIGLLIDYTEFHPKNPVSIRQYFSLIRFSELSGDSRGMSSWNGRPLLVTVVTGFEGAVEQLYLEISANFLPKPEKLLNRVRRYL
jgi:hypothetical protein